MLHKLNEKWKGFGEKTRFNYFWGCPILLHFKTIFNRFKRFFNAQTVETSPKDLGEFKIFGQSIWIGQNQSLVKAIFEWPFIVCTYFKKLGEELFGD